MKISNVNGRLGLIRGDGYIDVERASDGRFSAHIQDIYSRWDEFVDWAASVSGADVETFDRSALDAPVPAPRQVFAIGLNYRDHAEEANLEIPTESMVVFTKFPSSITGPNDEIVHPGGSVDFEAELVVVIGRTAFHIAADDAWSYVAGVTMGQDVSERELQWRPPSPQFGLGKSHPGFSPIGPVLVTPDEFADRDDIEIGCDINGEQMQKGRTGNMIFPVARVIEYLSGVLPLYPGDIIFTGTPAGVGFIRDPKRLLSPGDELVTFGTGIGEMRNRFVDSPY